MSSVESNFTPQKQTTIQKHTPALFAIDLKSFYASVECRERRLDPLTTNLVVADESRTDKTICLAVSPSLKAYGIPGRARLFEVKQKLRDIQRRTGQKIPFIIAPPRMQLYLDYSQTILNIYQQFVSLEDIHPYSIDEVFIDATSYLNLYHSTPRELATKMIHQVFSQTGITATAGIGTNLYLAKIAMDIVAKHVEPDQNGVRLAELNEQTYREKLWTHQPLTDFWRIGKGTANRLNSLNVKTMGDLARFSLYDEERLFKVFGVDAELLIDHAWGQEPCTMAAIKAYRPSSSSISSGQVLVRDYDQSEGEIILREMVERLTLELVQNNLAVHQIVLDLGYARLSSSHTGQDYKNYASKNSSSSNYASSQRAIEQPATHYCGPLKSDRYGRLVPRPSHGSVTFPNFTSSTQFITTSAIKLYRQLYQPSLFLRRLTVTLNNLIDITSTRTYQQLNIFHQATDQPTVRHEHQLQDAILKIKAKFGKNAILRGISFNPAATARQRNQQIGGHKA